MIKDKVISLYESYHDEMEMYARRRLGRDDAQDVVQDVYLRLLRYTDHHQLENPRAYLYRVTANVILRFGDRHKGKQPTEDIANHAETLLDEAQTPEQAAITDQMLQQCLSALDELPSVYRHVFILNRMEGVSLAEIACTLKIPLRSVERYIARALAQCVEHLEK